MNDQTLFFRQVNPNFLVEGVLTSQAFTPFPKDQGGLSVYDGDQVSPQEAYRHYTEEQHLLSAGVWGVSGEEVKSLDLSYCADPVEGNSAHALIEFGQRTNKECRKLAKRLVEYALSRGRLYPKE
ncbi:hypothetical protein [Vandammella animalimorsus]|uniref:hypothetical protein n=1 Tax=Vandammella animalimorsus TaxID=2029117 RepID=UPI000F5F1A1D|nr:hypothetical protein [Vandammella animalimorsus]RRD57900.1 hypothetical protein EII20_05340 [Comamonadaceae bacterium OH2545_COT-014]